MSSPRSPLPPTTHHSSNKPMHPLAAASKLMSSVKRSFSPSSHKKRTRSSVTPIHGRDDSTMPSPYREDNNAGAPPSISQIAMGLHLSRTPHLRPLGPSQHNPYPPIHTGRYPTHSASHSQSRSTSASSSQRMTPTRSSLKKPSAAASSSSMSHSVVSDLSVTSASLSTITSNTISTPRSKRSLSSFRLRVPWLSSAPPTNPNSIPRKKAVRFS